MAELKKPKVFISYSWSSPEHQEWVLDLARSLHDDNVDVIIDKWDLREGQSVIDFMESMVVDPSIDKIIMVIDSQYQIKADSRNGGVGTESTILSNVMYDKKSTSNIVAVIAETGARPPVFYSGRVFIDLSSEEKYAENYENLTRWIYGKFKHERPKTLGRTPSFIHEDDSTAILFTNTEFRIALEAIQKGKPNSIGFIKQFLNKLDAEIPKLSLKDLEDKEEAFLDNLKIFTAHLLEYKILLNAACEYNLEPKAIAQFKKFLEGLLRHTVNTNFELNKLFFETLNYWTFLTTITVLFKNDEFSQVKSILDEIYEVPLNHSKYQTERFSTFSIFNPEDSRILHKLFKDTEYNDPLAEVISRSVDNEIISFEEICETDIFLYLKSASKTINENKTFIMWWPHTYPYISSQRHSLKIFAKSESKEYFSEICKILGCADIALIENIISTSKEQSWGNVYIPKYNGRFGNFFDIKKLTNFEKLSSV